jgi:hypothetical protein
MSESNGGTFGSAPGSKATSGDLGFFASTPLSPPPTQPLAGTDDRFGGSAPSAAPAASAEAFDGPPPGAGALGGPPPPGQFGGPPPPGQFGGPPPIYAAPEYSPGKRGGLPVWAIVAICIPAGLVVLGILAAIAIPVFLNQRNTPVAPATLGGLATSTDPQMNTAVSSIRTELAKRNQSVKSKVAGYGGLRTGYVLMSFGARVDAKGEFQDLGATTPAVTIGDEQCASNPANNVSMCLRTSLRGGVEVASFGQVDLTKLAAITDEAWKAQPFG